MTKSLRRGLTYNHINTENITPERLERTSKKLAPLSDVRRNCKISIKIPKLKGIRAKYTICLVSLIFFRFSKIITDIKVRYIIKCTILSALENVTSLKLSPGARLKYAITKATVIDNIFFFTNFKI